MTTPRSAILRYFVVARRRKVYQHPEGEWMKAVDVEQDRAALLKQIETLQEQLRSNWRDERDVDRVLLREAEAENARLREQLQEFARQVESKVSAEYPNKAGQTASEPLSQKHPSTHSLPSQCDHAVRFVNGVRSNFTVRPGQRAAHWRCSKCGQTWHWDCPPRAIRIG